MERGGVFWRKRGEAAAKIKNYFALQPGSDSTTKTGSGGDLMAFNHPCAVLYPMAALWERYLPKIISLGCKKSWDFSQQPEAAQASSPPRARANLLQMLWSHTIQRSAKIRDFFSHIPFTKKLQNLKFSGCKHNLPAN